MLEAFIHRWYRPGFWFDMDAEGVREYVFGGKTGPENNVFNLVHDIAHVIQMPNAKLKKRFVNGNLSFKAPRKWIYDRYCTDPQTDSISRIELETFVIQAVMMQAVKPVSVIDYFHSNEIHNLFTWLPDNYLFHDGAFNTTEEFVDFVDSEVEKLLPVWHLARIERRWIELTDSWKSLA